MGGADERRAVLVGDVAKTPSVSAGTHRRVDPGRLRRPVGRGDRRRRRRRQSRRRIDRRQALDRGAEAAHPRQPRPRDAQPRRRDSRRRGAAAGVRQRIGGRLLRSARRRDRHRRDAGRDRIFSREVCVRWEDEATRAASDSHARRLHPHRPRAREGRRRAAADAAAVPVRRRRTGRIRAVSTGRGFTAQDWVALVRWAIATPAASGAINATAPNPVTNAEFARALGRAHAPARIHAGAGVCAAAAARRDGGRAAALGPERRAGESGARSVSRSSYPRRRRGARALFSSERSRLPRIRSADPSGSRVCRR